MRQVSCCLLHSERSLEASKAAGGAVQCSSIPELFAKATARQPEREPSPSPPCSIRCSPPAKRHWKPMLFPDRCVTQGARKASVAAGTEGSSTVRGSRSLASRAFPHLSHITAFCQLREWQTETPYLKNGWTAESRQHWQISQISHTKFHGQKISSSVWVKRSLLPCFPQIPGTTQPVRPMAALHQPWWMMPNSPAVSRPNSACLSACLSHSKAWLLPPQQGNNPFHVDNSVVWGL